MASRDHFLAAAVRRRLAAPGAEQLARALDVALAHRGLDAGEVVAELAEAEREVERGDVEQQRRERADPVERRVEQRRRGQRREHRDQPGDGAVARLAGVERALEPVGPGGLAAKGLDALRIAVNFSARQFQERHLTHTVSRVLADAGLEPQHLEIEITESIAMEGAEVVVANLNMLRSMGVGIAIDDFGTGYSSMSYLKRYPVTSLKIDRSFVTDLPTNPADAGIVRAIIEMAHGSGCTSPPRASRRRSSSSASRSAAATRCRGTGSARPLNLEGVDLHLAEQLALWKS